MSAVAPANSTVSFIRNTVRELTASPGEQQLTTAYIDQTLNNFYSMDFPYAIKLDQMRSVYEFYTVPYQEFYPLDVNYNQGVRSPVFIDGYQGYFYKDREEFYRTWPQWPTLFSNIITGDGIQSIFNFTAPGPFYQNSVTLGGTAVGANPILVRDDGNGNLVLQNPNPIISVPSATTNPAVPGMYNTNTANPGLLSPAVTGSASLTGNTSVIGSVNYVTGAFSVNFPAGYIPAIPTQDYPAMNLFVSQYQVGRPFALLFWNNLFHIRPVPKFVHKITVETYLTPVQFMLSTDTPILNQWSQYLAYGVAIEILRRRQDVAGVQNLMEGFKRQEGLVLERQATEEIGSRNVTIFSGAVPNQGAGNGFNQGFWY